MRFMTGMCFGAVLLMLIAARSDLGGLLERGAAHARSLSGEAVVVLEPGSNEASIAYPDDSSDRESAESLVAAGRVERASDADEIWPEETALPDAFAEDYAWWAPEGDAAAASGASEAAVAQSSFVRIEMPDVPVAEVPAADTPVPESGAPDASIPEGSSSDTGIMGGSGVGHSVPVVQPLLGGIASRPEQAIVWTPFHSEMSANGFARRLARALDHPFAVRRDGPGRYQVVFPYEGDSARDEVLARVAMLTGTQP